MRNFIITERQEELLLNTALHEESSYQHEDGPLYLKLKKYLDTFFKKGKVNTNKNGAPENIEIVVRMEGIKPIESMSDVQLFNHLQSNEHFKDILNPKDRDQFLKKGIIAWYNGKINPKTGNILP